MLCHTRRPMNKYRSGGVPYGHGNADFAMCHIAPPTVHRSRSNRQTHHHLLLVIGNNSAGSTWVFTTPGPRVGQVQSIVLKGLILMLFSHLAWSPIKVRPYHIASFATVRLHIIHVCCLLHGENNSKACCTLEQDAASASPAKSPDRRSPNQTLAGLHQLPGEASAM